MADRSLHPDSKGDTNAGRSRGSTTNPPRWVKVFGIIGLMAILLFGVLHLIGGGLGGHALPGGGHP